MEEGKKYRRKGMEGNRRRGGRREEEEENRNTYKERKKKSKTRWREAVMADDQKEGDMER